MNEHVLESNLNADKWIEVNQSSSKSDQKSKVWEKTSLEGLDERLRPLDKALTITEVVPEGLQDSLFITSKPYPVLPSPGQVLTSPGSPFQVNINVTSDKSGGFQGADRYFRSTWGAYKGLVERIVALILTLQRTCLPGSLICVRLTRDFEVDFEDLVGAFGRLVDDSGNTPRAGRS